MGHQHRRDFSWGQTLLKWQHCHRQVKRTIAKAACLTEDRVAGHNEHDLDHDRQATGHLKSLGGPQLVGGP